VKSFEGRRKAGLWFSEVQVSKLQSFKVPTRRDSTAAKA
jgi:hypothetical protein